MAKKSTRTTRQKRPKKTTKAQIPQPKKALAAPAQAETVPSVRQQGLPGLLKSRFQKQPTTRPVQLPRVWALTTTTAEVLWYNKGLFLAIAAWYAVLNLIFVQGLSNSANVANLKSSLDNVGSGNFGAIGSSLGIFTVLVSSTGNAASPTAGFYQLVFAVITTLATIWAIRQRINGTRIRIRDAYYKGMYPVIPFILVLLIICIQLIPFAIGATLYETVMGSGIAVHFIEQLFWLVLFIGLAIWSLYMVTATVFGLYVVTIPDMAPIKAMRTAKDLVKHRRLSVLWKILCLPIILLVIAAIIMLPVILIASSLAAWVLLVLSAIGLVAVNAYMYILYRELLDE